MPSPISNILEWKLYLYQPDETNGNFGSVSIYDIPSQRWEVFSGLDGNNTSILNNEESLITS